MSKVSFKLWRQICQILKSFFPFDGLKSRWSASVCGTTPAASIFSLHPVIMATSIFCKSLFPSVLLLQDLCRPSMNMLRSHRFRRLWYFCHYESFIRSSHFGKFIGGIKSLQTLWRSCLLWLSFSRCRDVSILRLRASCPRLGSFKMISWQFWMGSCYFLIGLYWKSYIRLYKHISGVSSSCRWLCRFKWWWCFWIFMPIYWYWPCCCRMCFCLGTPLPASYMQFERPFASYWKSAVWARPCQRQNMAKIAKSYHSYTCKMLQCNLICSPKCWTCVFQCTDCEKKVYPFWGAPKFKIPITFCWSLPGMIKLSNSIWKLGNPPWNIREPPSPWNPPP